MIDELTPLQQKRRETIIKNALEHFSQVGFHQADLDQIASKAGVGKGTIYNYFENKHDLFYKCIEFEIHHLIDYLRQELSPIQDIEEYFEQFVRLFVNYFVQNINSLRVIFFSSYGILEQVFDVIERSRESFYSQFEQRMNQGMMRLKLRPINPRLFIMGLEGCLIFIMYHQFRHKDQDPEEIIRLARQVFFHGILASPESSK
ncbi:MAG: TetR/AcrR family transcriptional regulator [Candidatus Delongbacteria bacterium]|nr:TetR/AcrR family transcriptional regulator [Candidatus Delongbacteria bacterium]